MSVVREDTQPWYQQFWPWALMSLPALTVVAGTITIWLAVVSSDGMVSDDYYKDGLAMNQSLGRDTQAAVLNISGLVRLSPEAHQLEVLTQGNVGPSDLVLMLMHATRGSIDQHLELTQKSDGVLTASYQPLALGKWYVRLESSDGEWRVSGQMRFPSERSARLLPRAAGG